MKRLLLHPGITVVAIVVSWLVMLWISHVLTVRLFREDSIFEWLQVALIGVAALLCFRSVRLAPDRAVRTIFVLLGALMAFVVLEELSWGQRLLNLNTPTFFESWNTQGELNIHNHFLVRRFQWAPFVLLGLVGLVAICLNSAHRFRASERLRALAPPRSFGLAFLCLLLFGLAEAVHMSAPWGAPGILQSAHEANFQEVPELAVAIVFLAYAADRYQSLHGRRADSTLALGAAGRTTEQTGGGMSSWVAIHGLVLSLGVISMLGLAAFDALALRHEPVHRSQTYAVYYDPRGPTRDHAVHFVNSACDPGDMAGRFFVHSFPVRSGDLQPLFAERGFRNLDFEFASFGWRMFGVCWLRIGLPHYPIASLRFGHYIVQPSGTFDHIWGGEHSVIHP